MPQIVKVAAITHNLERFIMQIYLIVYAILLAIVMVYHDGDFFVRNQSF